MARMYHTYGVALTVTQARALPFSIDKSSEHCAGIKKVMSHVFRAIAIGAFCYFSSNVSARSDTIISVTGAIEGLASFIGGSPNQVLASSWSTTQGYENVQISTSIGSLDPNFANGTAFLSSKIGSGTTSSDIIATAPFRAP